MKSVFQLVLLFSLALILSEEAAQAASQPAPKSPSKPTFRPGRAKAKVPRQTAPSTNRRNGMVAAPQAPSFFANIITTAAQFDAISSRGQGIVKSDVVKFLIDLRNGTPQIYFINGNFGAPNSPSYVQYHFDFAKQVLKIPNDGEAFNNSTYFAKDLATRRFIAGTVQNYTVVSDGKSHQFFGIQFYPQDYLTERGILLAAQTVKAAFQIPGTEIKFVSYGLQQTVATVLPELSQLGVGITSINEIYGKIPFIAMNAGEAWGYLRVNPKSEDLKSEDIPLFDELPLDLSVVAATITTVIQDAGSHINLKSKERKTPNMVLRDADKVRELIQKWEGRPIHLKITNTGYTVEAATHEQTQSHVKTHENKPWVDFNILRFTTLLSFDEMAKNAKASQVLPFTKTFGGKAAKLGLLAHKEILGEGSKTQKALGYRLTPLGFGIPTSFYFDLVKANPALEAKIQKLVDSEMSRNKLTPLEPREKNAAITEIQNLFYSAAIPPELLKALEIKFAQLDADVSRVYPKSKLKKVKLRSSSNAEDVEDFDGAGLHDSFSASLKKGLGQPIDVCKLVSSTDGVATKQEMEPETVLCGLRGVYASLWNKRAVEERSFARINHFTAGMGIAVNPTYNLREKSEGITQLANGVLITRIMAGEGIYGYQFSLNTEDNLVTNPSPGTQSEVVLATFLDNEKAQYTITQLAKTAASEPVRTSSLVTPAIYDRIMQLARATEEGYCKAEPAYYNGDCSYVSSDADKPKSLDMEFKIFSNGEVLVKQVREFGGSAN